MLLFRLGLSLSHNERGSCVYDRNRDKTLDRFLRSALTSPLLTPLESSSVREDQNLVPENPGMGVEASNPPMARWAGASCIMENLIQIVPPCFCLQTKFVRMRISRCFSLISAGDFIALRELASCHSWIVSFSVMEFIAAVSTCSVLPRSVCVKFQFSFNLLKGTSERRFRGCYMCFFVACREVWNAPW
jgi:hypothetical protein